MNPQVKFNLHWLTRAQYDALVAQSQTIAEDIYFISDQPILFVNGEQRGRTVEEIRALCASVLLFANTQPDLAGGTISDTKAPSYTKIVYVESESRFLAVSGTTYYTSWDASGVTPESAMYTSANADALYHDGESIYGWVAGTLTNLSANVKVIELSSNQATVEAYTDTELKAKFPNIQNLFAKIVAGKQQILVQTEEGIEVPVAFAVESGTPNKYTIALYGYKITISESSGTLSAAYTKQKISRIDDSILDKTLRTTLREAAEATDNSFVTERGIRTVVDALKAAIETLEGGSVAKLDTDTAYTYTAVAETTGKNPASEGWYEKKGDLYVLTEDTTPEAGKTYYTRSANPEQFALVGKDAEGTIVTSVNLDRENFMSAFDYRDATQEDVDAGHATAVGDKLLVVTMTNGAKFYVDVTELMNIYTGDVDGAMTVTVTGDKIKATLALDNSSKTVALTQTTTGLKADVIIKDQSSQSVFLEKTNDGLAVQSRWITHE
jgi:hypothetical protein